MAKIKIDKAVIVKTVVFLILIIVITLIAIYLYRKYFFNNNFINKILLQKDMEFKFFTYDEFDSRKGTNDNDVDTYFRNSGEYIVNSGKENFDENALKSLDLAREKIENTWNVANPEQRIVFVINSGVRSESRNSDVGGVSKSAHRNMDGEKATAVDISWYKYNQQQKDVIEASLREQGFNRVGIANSFIHVDKSKRLPNPANWTY